MKLRALAAAAGALMMMTGGPAFAKVASENPNAVPGDKMVCKNQQRTGTRFATKICRTMTQWDQISEDARRNLKDTVDRPQFKSCGPSGCGG